MAGNEESEESEESEEDHETNFRVAMEM